MLNKWIQFRISRIISYIIIDITALFYNILEKKDFGNWKMHSVSIKSAVLYSCQNFLSSAAYHKYNHSE